MLMQVGFSPPVPADPLIIELFDRGLGPAFHLWKSEVSLRRYSYSAVIRSLSLLSSAAICLAF
jgi:hypothetical protein